MTAVDDPPTLVGLAPTCERERPDTTSADDVDPRTGRRTAERAMTQHAAVVHQMITATTEMLLISDPAIPAVHAELRYLCDDPLAVQMLLSIEQSPAICWILSRDLLITGAAMPSGVGDVQVYPTHDGVIIELRSGVYVVALLAYAPGRRRVYRPDPGRCARRRGTGPPRHRRGTGATAAGPRLPRSMIV